MFFDIGREFPLWELNRQDQARDANVLVRDDFFDRVQRIFRIDIEIGC